MEATIEELKARLAAQLNKATPAHNALSKRHDEAVETTTYQLAQLQESVTHEMEWEFGDLDARSLLNESEYVLKNPSHLSGHLERVLSEDDYEQASRDSASYNAAAEEIKELMNSLREILQREVKEMEKREAEEAAREEEARQHKEAEARREWQESRGREEQEREKTIIEKLTALGPTAWDVPPSRWGLGRITYQITRTLTRLVLEGKVSSHQKTPRHVLRYALVQFAKP